MTLVTRVPRVSWVTRVTKMTRVTYIQGFLQTGNLQPRVLHLGVVVSRDLAGRGLHN